EEEQLGHAHEGLREEQPLLLAARETAELAVGVFVCVDGRDGVGGFGLCLFSSAHPDAPPVAVDAEADEVAAADRKLRVEVGALRDVADAGVASVRLLAEHFEVAS